MAFVELTDTSGATVLVNPLGVVYLRAAAPDPGDETARTDVHLSGRTEPLRVAGTPADVARSLDDAVPVPTEPTLSLLG